jgi:hypothetical protein
MLTWRGYESMGGSVPFYPWSRGSVTPLADFTANAGPHDGARDLCQMTLIGSAASADDIGVGESA